jgi:hypothetical protein
VKDLVRAGDSHEVLKGLEEFGHYFMRGCTIQFLGRIHCEALLAYSFFMHTKKRGFH